MGLFRSDCRARWCCVSRWWSCGCYRRLRDRGREQTKGLSQRSIIVVLGQRGWSSAGIVTSVRIGPMTKKLADHLSLPGQPVRPGFTVGFPKAPDCLVEWRKSEGVVAGGRSAGGKQYLDACRVALETGFMQRGISLAVYRIDSRALCKEQFDQREIAMCRRRDQGGGPTVVSCLDVCATIEKDLNPCRRSLSQRLMNRKLLRWLVARCWCSPIRLPCLNERQACEGEEQNDADDAGAVMHSQTRVPVMIAREMGMGTVWFSIQSCLASLDLVRK